MPGQTVAEPVMAPGWAGAAGLTVMLLEDAELLPQVPVAMTDIDPVVDPVVTEIDVLPCPELIVQPDGTLQVYPVAPTTAPIE